MALPSDEEEVGLSPLARRLGGGKVVLPPKGTIGTNTGTGGKVPGTTTTTTTTTDTSTTKTPKNPLLNAGKKKAASKTSTTDNTYAKYLAAQKAEAAAAKKKAGNRYVDQAQTLGLQAKALRALLGLGPDDFRGGGRMKDKPGKKGKTAYEIQIEKGKQAQEYVENHPNDPRNKFKHPWQTDDGRGASGNRNEPKKGGLPGVNLPGGRRPRG